MTAETIYNLFKRELDGEEFDSDEDALEALNVAYKAELGERDWEFLKKTITLAPGTTDLSTITDLKRVYKVWAVYGTNTNDRIELSKASFDNRFDTSKDYYIDYTDNNIGLINEDYISSYLVVDYIYKPAELEIDDEPVFPDDYHAILGYKMILDYKEKDQDFTGYNEVMNKYSKLKGSLVDYNEDLKYNA